MVYNSTIRKQEEQKLELKWFGEYRELIEKMILYGNSYARTYKISCPRSHGFKLSPAEMQVIEYLLENEERQENMLEISQRLGISASSFTNLAAKLVKMGLLEKYHMSNNRKAVIVLVSPLGKEIYAEYAKEAEKNLTDPITEILSGIPKEHIDAFAKALDYLAKVSAYPELRNQEDGKDSVKLIPIEE